VISKVIARVIQARVSKNISPKQFGFLKGKKIQEAIGVAQ
jgi:hypothetical protein